MSLFFTIPNLTHEQRLRWHDCIDIYNQVIAVNSMLFGDEAYLNQNRVDQVIANRLLNGTDDNSAALARAEAKLMKSALFARLLNGELPFLYPPPTYWSYPFYAALETNAPIDVTEPEFSDDKSLQLGRDTWWIRENFVAKGEFLIVSGAWARKDLGFLWLLKKTTSENWQLQRISPKQLSNHHYLQIKK